MPKTNCVNQYMWWHVQLMIIYKPQEQWQWFLRHETPYECWHVLSGSKNHKFKINEVCHYDYYWFLLFAIMERRDIHFTTVHRAPDNTWKKRKKAPGPKTCLRLYSTKLATLKANTHIHMKSELFSLDFSIADSHITWRSTLLVLLRYVWM